MDFQKNIHQGIFYSFIPKQLKIENKPELFFFPYNVLFAKWLHNGVMGTAVYKPDFSTYKDTENISTMEYYNSYNINNRLLITYNKINKNYIGEKYINGKSVGSAVGNNWKIFFIHFTALGLINSETCMFETIKNN